MGRPLLTHVKHPSTHPLLLARPPSRKHTRTRTRAHAPTPTRPLSLLPPAKAPTHLSRLWQHSSIFIVPTGTPVAVVVLMVAVAAEGASQVTHTPHSRRPHTPRSSNAGCCDCIQLISL